jgi:N6-adenosine-specific RNA methylase IME4
MLPVEWQSEKNPFIRLSNVSETIKMNNAFDVLNSNCIFALQQNNIRDNNSFVYVAAENITFEILK